MKLKTKNLLKGLQFALTIGIVVMMLSTMVSLKENYPFAPYTMYSYTHNIADLQFYRFFCRVGNQEIPVVKDMIIPLDEARLDTSINTSYIENKDFEGVKNKLKELKIVIKRNSYPCDNALLKVIKFKDAEKFLENDGDILNQLEGKL